MREKKDINIEIGGNIQVAREQAGYTQDTLSEMLGMTPNHLSAIERGASGKRKRSMVCIRPTYTRDWRSTWYADCCICSSYAFSGRYRKMYFPVLWRCNSDQWCS